MGLVCWRWSALALAAVCMFASSSDHMYALSQEFGEFLILVNVSLRSASQLNKMVE